MARLQPSWSKFDLRGFVWDHFWMSTSRPTIPPSSGKKINSVLLSKWNNITITKHNAL